MTLSLDVVVRRGRFVVTAAFDAADGETLAILGPNGAGKTTLLDAIAGVLPLERGRVGIDGRAVEALPPEERGVGVAFQDGLL
ncbi:MAG TPA: ATP-binding cassette domain-containing protein, partial [Actinomycetota bacterium]